MSELLKLISEMEQDETNCREWWRESTLSEKMRVWDAIQKEYDDGVMEVMSRFAQLAFARAAVEYGQ